MSKNRFAGLKGIKTLQDSASAPALEKETQPKQETSNNKDIETRRRGRPNGKRSDANFQQVTAYIGRDTYKKTKMKLLAANEPQEFSELVDLLLNKWLKE